MKSNKVDLKYVIKSFQEKPNSFANTAIQISLVETVHKTASPTSHSNSIKFLFKKKFTFYSPEKQNKHETTFMKFDVYLSTVVKHFTSRLSNSQRDENKSRKKLFFIEMKSQPCIMFD
jgi:hypothetical protein